MTERVLQKGILPNGRTLRTFVHEGLVLSEVEFRPDDGFPLCVGYMVGWNDGFATLSGTPESAVGLARSGHLPECDVLTITAENIAKPCNCKRQAPAHSTCALRGGTVSTHFNPETMNPALVAMLAKEQGVRIEEDFIGTKFTNVNTEDLLKLLRERQAGLADSERLDWLDAAQVSVVSPGVEVGKPHWSIYALDGEEIVENPGPVRAAIDAAKGSDPSFKQRP